MAATSPVLDDLLNPISAQWPAGSDLRWSPEWDRIKEARRSDDSLDLGKWAKKESKSADWRLVRELSVASLRERTKDLQISLWFTEANLKLYGFPGLREGFWLTRALLVRYWDQGLYPSIEDGPEDRAGPFEWLNDKLVDAILATPITARSDSGGNFSLLEVRDARAVGSESSWKTDDGFVDDDRKRAYDAAISQGRVSLDMVNRAIKATGRAHYEQFSSVFQDTHSEFLALEKQVDEKFGDEAPNLAACRSVLREIQAEISGILDQIPALAQPPVATEESISAPPSDRVMVPSSLALSATLGAAVGSEALWHEAEILVRSGQVDRGLSEMTRLTAAETSGRNRFQRKLLLAEICLATNRERLALSILEELSEQIDKFQLDSWEASDLIGRVWIKLHVMYKNGQGGSPDSDRAAKLYERLCRLDPWQALACGR